MQSLLRDVTLPFTEMHNQHVAASVAACGSEILKSDLLADRLFFRFDSHCRNDIDNGFSVRSFSESVRELDR